MPELLEPLGIARRFGLASERRGQPLRLHACPGDPAFLHALHLARAAETEIAVLPGLAPSQPGFPRAAFDWATSGAMALTGPASGPPRFAAGAVATAARGVARLLGALAPRSRLVGLDGPALLGERAAIAGLTRAGRSSAGGSARLLETADATLVVNLPREDDWRLVPAWLESLAEPAGFPHRSEAARWEEIAHSLRSRASEAMVERGRMMGLAVASAPRAPLADDARFFKRTHESLRGAERPPRPLRLLDLSTLWAGPLATGLLALAGVEVLKIESPSRPDGAREGPAPFFDLMNGDKRGACLDLRAADGRRDFEALLDSADIVVESARPRALSQLGYDAGSWLEERPGRLWVSITGYGRDHEWIAFGDDAAAAAGLAWSPSPSDEGPCFCGDALADPITGLHAAALVLLHARLGLGGLLDLAMVPLTARVAAAEHDGLTTALEPAPSGQGWQLVDDERRLAVAAPRARVVRAKAPPLVAEASAGTHSWQRRPC
jgi:crotonobetainyl-CoA:carnitine CoA-transferase CaiB-like acyl-CoA transferase